MSQQEKKDFTFINEHIKTKPFYKRKWFIKTGSAVGLAIIFGAVAGLAFAIITPWAKQKFGEPPTQTRMVISQEDETEEQTVKDTEKETEKPTENRTEEPETEKQSEITPPQTVIEEKNLDLSDYKRLYSQMSAVANQAKKAVVTVIGSSSNPNLFNEVSENHVEASGLIVAANSTYMYILTEADVIDSAQRLRVSFPDDTVVDAELQKSDTITGMAVIRVSLGRIPKATKNLIDTSALASSCGVSQGEPVIAIGNPLGYNDSIAFGMVTSVLPVSVEDREYHMINTDMNGSSEGSGILVNLDGKIVGIITRDLLNEYDQNTVCAISIAEARSLIENMTNNVDMAYMGIIGTEVTENMMKESSIPSGIYIKEIASDSPAMFAGLQRADVLISINENNVADMNDYSRELEKLSPEDVVHIIVMRQGTDGSYVERHVDVTLGYAQ